MKRKPISLPPKHWASSRRKVVIGLCATHCSITRSSQSIKIVKSDLIDIDCIDQSVEIDDTFVSLIYFACFFSDFIDLYRKIYLFICSSKNENWFHGNSKFIDNWVAIESRRIKQLSIFKKIFLKNLRNLIFSSKPGLKSSGSGYPAFHDLDLPPFRRRCSSGCSYILE